MPEQLNNKTINKLGKVPGKLLFFGGVYSNLQALEALQSWATENYFHPANIFCTGDVLGYCAQPLECIELLQEWGIHTIAGNVELQLRNNEDSCGCDFTTGGRCDLFSKNWYSYTRSKMTGSAIDWLHTLPHHIKFEYYGQKLTVLHGSWANTSEYIFESTPWEVKQKSLDESGSQIIVAGHSGIPFSTIKDSYYWLNAGVIGMPANDGEATVWFMTLENNNEELLPRFHQLKYDNVTTSNLMKANGLPPSYAQTLLTGLWDNCEILPAKETAMQGKKLSII
jgi:predicted phosphodiesterase